MPPFNFFIERDPHVSSLQGFLERVNKALFVGARVAQKNFAH
jgi:hypothetical protein